MLDYDKINRLKRLSVAGALIITFIFGIGIGQIGKNTQSETKPGKQPTSSQTRKVLDQKTVKDFLISYYTKKDLGENRSRYKTYMTESMYNKAVEDEEASTSVTYKGFLVDYEYQDAQIYIDESNLTALAIITYRYTQLSQRDNYRDAQTGLTNTLTLRLQYLKQDNTYLVNNMTEMTLTEGAENNGNEGAVAFSATE